MPRVIGPQLLAPNGGGAVAAPGALTIRWDIPAGSAVDRADLYYSRDGGVTWSAWAPATCSGSKGTTARQTITAPNVPFSQRSTYRNLVRFRIRDVAGNLGTSGTYRVNTAP